MQFDDSIESVHLRWTREKNSNCISFYQDDVPTKYVINVLSDDLIRVRVWPKGEPVTTRTWAIVDEETNDVPYEGRLRHEIATMSLTCVKIMKDDHRVIISTDTLTCTVNLHRPFAITWLNNNNILLQDNPVCSYHIEKSLSHQIRHTLCRPTSDDQYYYYGLGEKSGPLDKKSRRYRMRNMDAMGYNAELSDPLYKHIPFYITLRNEHAFGVFYDTTYDCTFDMGCEIDNYYGDMIYFETPDPDLDYYFINGPSIEQVVERYTKLTGRYPLAPKWTLGYLGSAMRYTDAPNAQEMLENFITRCNENEIECTAFHLSSGYSMSSEDGKRYVFVWDKKRVPSPPTMTDKFHQAGMKILANIKPAMLTTHPHFDQCRSLFIQDGSRNEPDLAPFWGGFGAHLDFTNPDTVTWWKQQVTTQLLGNGIDCTWNDNNEFNVRNPNARCHNGQSIEAMRPVQTILMIKTSYDAQMTTNGEKYRPWLLTRAACPGAQRYAGTWTGDNRCSWHTLKFNIPMGLNLSLSGFPLIGHDIGGFAGEKPSLELFVRWIQNGIFHPRFCVHSWRPNSDDNEDGGENALWMYEDALPLIHDALRFRARLRPYLYSLMHEAALSGHPIIRPLVYHFQQDVKCRDQSFEFLLGRWLLVASIFEENATSRTLYLPEGACWYDFWTDELYDGGQTITVPAALDVFPLFVREGAIIPFEMNDYIEVHVYPFQGEGESEFELYDDDGETMNYSLEQGGKFDLQTIRLSCNRNQIHMEVFPIEGSTRKIKWRFPERETRSCQ